MRCPRPGEVTQPPGSGGAGAPLAGTKTGREELADGARYPSQDGSAARSAARHRNDTAMERRGAQASRVMRCLAPKRCDPRKGASRRSIPPACPEAEGEAGVTRAA